MVPGGRRDRAWVYVCPRLWLIYSFRHVDSVWSIDSCYNDGTGKVCLSAAFRCNYWKVPGKPPPACLYSGELVAIKAGPTQTKNPVLCCLSLEGLGWPGQQACLLGTPQLCWEGSSYLSPLACPQLALGSSARGIFQARVGCHAYLQGISSQPRDWSPVSFVSFLGFSITNATWEAKDTETNISKITGPVQPLHFYMKIRPVMRTMTCFP